MRFINKLVIGLIFVSALLTSLALLGAFVAFLAGNSSRSKDLFIGFIGWFIVSAFLVALFAALSSSRSIDDQYNDLVTQLNRIKHSTLPIDYKISRSKQLIEQSSMSLEDQKDLASQILAVYSTRD